MGGMGRWFVVFVRRALFVLGVGVLAALVLDSFCDFRMETSWPRDSGRLGVSFGAVRLACADLPGGPQTFATAGSLTPHEAYVWFPLPEYQHSGATNVRSTGYQQWSVEIPLWLLTAICLVWPVTSFIQARKRGVRGFEVEGVAAIPEPPGGLPDTASFPAEPTAPSPPGQAAPRSARRGGG